MSIGLSRCAGTIPKAGKPGEFRTLGIPTIYDRVCQQRCLIGWTRSSSRCSMKPTSDIGEAIDEGCHAQSMEGDSERSEWIVDADLKDFFGSVNHAKLLSLVAQE